MANTQNAPTLIEGTAGFQPTNLMQRVLVRHLRSLDDPDVEKTKSPPVVLKTMGHDRTTWYKWLRMSGFKAWWDKAMDEQLGGGTLRCVHAHLAKLAQTQRDSSIIKLYLERFDKSYKPTTAQEHSLHTGQRPPDQDVQAAIARSRARLAKHVDSKQRMTLAAEPKVITSKVLEGAPGNQQADNTTSVPDNVVEGPTQTMHDGQGDSNDQ
jgi:hypothetical protein